MFCLPEFFFFSFGLKMFAFLRETLRWLEKFFSSQRNFAVVCILLRNVLFSWESFRELLVDAKVLRGRFCKRMQGFSGECETFPREWKRYFFLPLSNIFFITISLWGSVAFCFGLVQILTFRCSSSFLKCRHISYFSVQTHTRYMLACLVLASGHILSPEHR